MEKAGRVIWEADLFFLSLTLLSGSIINCKLKHGILPLSSLSSQRFLTHLCEISCAVDMVECVVTKDLQLHTPACRHTRRLHTVKNTGTLIEEQLHIPQQEGREQQLRVMENIPLLFVLVPPLYLSLSTTLLPSRVSKG